MVIRPNGPVAYASAIFHATWKHDSIHQLDKDRTRLFSIRNISIEGTVNLSRTVQNITSSLGSNLLIVGRGNSFQKPKTGQLSLKLTVPPNCRIIDVGIVGENYRPTTNTEGVYNDEHTSCIGN